MLVLGVPYKVSWLIISAALHLGIYWGASQWNRPPVLTSEAGENRGEMIKIKVRKGTSSKGQAAIDKAVPLATSSHLPSSATDNKVAGAYAPATAAISKSKQTEPPQRSLDTQRSQDRMLHGTRSKVLDSKTKQDRQPSANALTLSHGNAQTSNSKVVEAMAKSQPESAPSDPLKEREYGTTPIDLTGSSSPDGFQRPFLIRSSYRDPGHTQEAFAEGIEGRFTAKILVNTQGQAEKVELLRPIGFGMDERVKQALTAARFRPARNGEGRRIAAWYPQQIIIEIN